MISHLLVVQAFSTLLSIWPYPNPVIWANAQQKKAIAIANNHGSDILGASSDSEMMRSRHRNRTWQRICACKGPQGTERKLPSKLRFPLAMVKVADLEHTM